MRIILEKSDRLDIFKPTCSHSYEHVFIFSCDYIAIGNGFGCRETEKFISKLIEKGAFAPCDVAYW